MAKDNSWAYNLESKIFTIVKSKVTPKIKTKFPKANFTMSDKNTGSPVFPTIYIHQNGGLESPVSLENDMIERVLYTIQIDVITNTTQADANTIMSNICDVMKDMKFTIISLPTFKNTSEQYRNTARFRRYIDGNDTL